MSTLCLGGILRGRRRQIWWGQILGVVTMTKFDADGVCQDRDEEVGALLKLTRM